MAKNKTMKKYLEGYLYILPNFIGFFVFMAVPIIMGFVISLTDYNGFNQFNFVGIKNYLNMFKDEYFRVSLWNNILYTLVTVPGTVVAALLLAVGVNKGIRGTKLFRTLFFLPTISSMVARDCRAAIFNPNSGPVNMFLKGIGITNVPMDVADFIEDSPSYNYDYRNLETGRLLYDYCTCGAAVDSRTVV